LYAGGSKNDAAAACNRHGISMIFTGRRHFLRLSAWA
jgi:AICAR transformylase/IMP cyclohydrolase PurH